MRRSCMPTPCALQVKIAKVLGTEALDKYLNKYNLKLEPVFDEIMGT
jgi:hypothetical protein